MGVLFFCLMEQATSNGVSKEKSQHRIATWQRKMGDSFMTTYRPDMTGLTSVEAKRLQEQYGKNELTQQKKENFGSIINLVGCSQPQGS
jgi:magnesium-transporting ATPase (P-type)